MSIFAIFFILAASAGAFARMQLVNFIVAPWGTLLANVLGSLLIGFLAVYLSKYSPQTKAVVLVALLGSLTTFSSYSLDMIQLFEEGLYGRAVLYFSLSNMLTVLACLMGWKMAQQWNVPTL